MPSETEQIKRRVNVRKAHAVLQHGVETQVHAARRPRYYLAFRMAFAQAVVLVLECGWIKGLGRLFLQLLPECRLFRSSLHVGLHVGPR